MAEAIVRPYGDSGKHTAPPGYEYVKDPARPGKYKLRKLSMAEQNDHGPVKPGTKRPIAKPKATAPAGYEYVLIKGSKPPKYRLRKKATGAAAATGAATGAVTAPAEKPMGFVEAEIARQVGQDQQLTNYVDRQTGSIADTMMQQAGAAADIAGKYQPTTEFRNPLLDASAQQRAADDIAVTNQVNQDQSGALATLIGRSGQSAAGLLGNMRGALALQHRDYSRRLEGLRPELERQYNLEQLAIKQQEAEAKRAAEAHRMAMATQRLTNQLAQQRFGLDAQAQQFAQENYGAGGSGSGADGEPVNKGIYGFGADRDESIQAIIGSWQAAVANTQNGMTEDAKGNPLPQSRHPWRDLHQSLIRGAGLNPDQAALLATRMSPDSIRNANKGARGVVQMLRNRGVSEKVQAWIIKKYFGKETWTNISTGGSQRPAGAQYGTHAPGAQRPDGPPASKPMPTRRPKPGYMWHWAQGAQAWVQIKKPNWRPLGN